MPSYFMFLKLRCIVIFLDKQYQGDYQEYEQVCPGRRGCHGHEGRQHKDVHQQDAQERRGGREEQGHEGRQHEGDHQEGAQEHPGGRGEQGHQGRQQVDGNVLYRCAKTTPSTGPISQK